MAKKAQSGQAAMRRALFVEMLAAISSGGLRGAEDWCQSQCVQRRALLSPRSETISGECRLGKRQEGQLKSASRRFRSCSRRRKKR